MSTPRGKVLKGYRSEARVSFFDNSSDVRSLWSLHQGIKAAPNFRAHLAVANKGVYLLVAALWETYCEDLLYETARHLVAEVPNHKALPEPLLKFVAMETKQDAHELSPWRLAGEGWRDVTRGRIDRLFATLVFNTPKTTRIDELFERSLGLKQISADWSSSRTSDCRTALDACLQVRGSLAHTAGRVTITKRDVSHFYQLVSDLTACMDLTAGKYLQEATGADPFQRQGDDSTP